MAARLFEEIREKRGLAYAVATSFDEYTTYGSLATYAGVAHENVAKTIPLVLAEYQKIRDVAVPDVELTRAKESLKGRLAISLEASDDLAFFVGGEEVMTGRPMTTDAVFARLDAVSREEVQAVAGRIFRPEGLNLAVIGPIRDQEPLAALLADFR
jgi:predicted Zn-dependent peptidase